MLPMLRPENSTMPLWVSSGNGHLMGRHLTADISMPPLLPGVIITLKQKRRSIVMWKIYSANKSSVLHVVAEILSCLTLRFLTNKWNKVMPYHKLHKSDQNWPSFSCRALERSWRDGLWGVCGGAENLISGVAGQRRVALEPVRRWLSKKIGMD